MSAADLKADFPQLEILTDEELEAAIAHGGMFSAFAHAHIKRLSTPRSAGRPRKTPKVKKTFQRRGRHGDMSENSTNIQLAELAQVYAECLKCTNTEAARAVLMEIKGTADPALVRKLAKLISELPGRAHDRAIQRVKPKKSVSDVEQLSSFSGMLQHYANLRK